SFDAPGAVPPFGTVPFSLNNRGDIVGNFVNGAGDPVFDRHGFLLSKGVWTQLDVAGAGQTGAPPHQESGENARVFVDSDFNDLGWVRRKGAYTTVDVPSAAWTDIYNVNAEGTIVGAYGDAGGNTHGYIGIPCHDD